MALNASTTDPASITHAPTSVTTGPGPTPNSATSGAFDTAKAMPQLLKELKANGYKIVQLTAKDPVKTLPEYDELTAKEMQGMPTALSDRPLNSVVRTISGQ